MKHPQSKSKGKFFMIIGLVVIVGLVYAINTWDTGYRVATGTTATVYGGSGGAVCKKVTNNCTAGDVFVPTKSDAEWQGADGFINKKPSCVTITECGCRTNSDCGAGEFCLGYVAASDVGSCLGGVFVPTPITACVHAESCCKVLEGVAPYYTPWYYAQDPQVVAGGCYRGSPTSPGTADYTSCVAATSYNLPCTLTQTNSCSPSSACYPQRITCGSLSSKNACQGASACTWSGRTIAEVMGQCTPPASCTLPRGGTIAHGASVTAYAASSVLYGGVCLGETRTCNNGTLGGSYTNQTCSVQGNGSCTTPWGTTVSNGASVKAYLDVTAPKDGSGPCVSQTRTCTNGVLGGTYQYGVCDDPSCGTPTASVSSLNLAQPTWCEGWCTSGDPEQQKALKTKYSPTNERTNTYHACSRTCKGTSIMKYCFITHAPFSVDWTTNYTVWGGYDPAGSCVVGDRVYGCTKYLQN